MTGLESTTDASISGRQRAVLQLIVQEYVATGRAVGSKALTERYPTGVSPATIRNAMAELEQAGYIQHMHTSGGRVPTDRGYRYYVHHLLGAVELSPVDQIMISHQFRQVEVQLDQWMELAASVLAESAGNVSVVSAPRTAVPRLRHFELIALQPRAALLILVTNDSQVRQMMVHWPEDADQDVLSRLSDAMVVDVRGMSADELAARAFGASGAARAVLHHLETGLRGLDAVERTEVRHSGLEKILAQPEFGGTDLRQLFDLLRGGAFLSAVLPQLVPGSDVQVFIGDENPADELRNYGLVVSTYGVDGAVTGLLAVLGPTRMPYGRSISSVRYLARLMSDLVADLYSA